MCGLDGRLDRCTVCTVELPGTSDGGKQHRNGGSQGKTACGSAHQLHLFRQRQARDVSIDPQVEIKIARQGQNAGERFCKYRNHNVKRFCLENFCCIILLICSRPHFSSSLFFESTIAISWWMRLLCGSKPTPTTSPLLAQLRPGASRPSGGSSRSAAAARIGWAAERRARGFPGRIFRQRRRRGHGRCAPNYRAPGNHCCRRFVHKSGGIRR